MNGIRTLRLLGLLALLGAFLASCTAIRTVYNQAEHLVAWRLNDYFDLSETQRAFFHERFASFHRWHRRSQLTNYVALLNSAEQRVERGPTRNDIEWLRSQTKVRAQAALAHGHEDVVALLSGLTDSQVAQARQRFERDNRKWAHEHGVGESVDDQRRLRVKLDVDRIEHWTGPLTREQKARVAELSSTLPLDAQAHYRDRLRRQNEFLALLGERKDAARFSIRLRQWLDNWDASRPADLAAELDRFDRLRADMLIEVHTMLAPPQRDKLKERVRWYADALRELSGGAATAQPAPVDDHGEKRRTAHSG